MDACTNDPGFFPRRTQKGAALVVSLIILLILTILGVAGMRSSTLEERMAGNARDRHLAFEATEAGLLAGEQFLRASVFLYRQFR